MAKKKQVAVRVEPEQKEKWTQHAEENDSYRSLTNLVEASVEARIAEDTAEWTLRDEIGEVIGLLEQQQQRSERIEELAEEISEKKADDVKIEEEVEKISGRFDTRLQRIEKRLQNNE